MHGWYIAVERKSSVGRGIFEIEEEEFEITDISTTVKYSQKELLRHRVWIKGNRMVFYNAGVVQHDGIFFQDDDTYMLEWDEDCDFVYEKDSQNYKTGSILEDSENIVVEIFTCTSGIFFEEDVWIYVPMHWLNMKEYQSKSDNDPFDKKRNSNVPLLLQAIGDKKIDTSVHEKMHEVCLLGSHMHSAELMVVLERPEFEGLQKLTCKYMKWYGDVLSVLQSAWHMNTLQYLDMSFSSLNSHHTPVVGVKSMNFSFCDLERLEFQREGYNSIHELLLCGNINIQNWDVLYQMNELEILDVRETYLEVDMKKISKKIRILRADKMIHFEPHLFSNLQYVEIEGRNIFLEKIESTRRLYSKDLYFSGGKIKKHIVPFRKNISLHIEKCLIDKKSLQRLSEFNPAKIYMNDVSFSSEMTAQEFFDSALFSNVKTLVICNMNVSWSVLSSSNHMLQVESLWMDAVEKIDQMYLVGSFCGLQLLCIEKLEEDIQKFLKLQAFPTLEYFMRSEPTNSSMQLWSTTELIPNISLGSLRHIDWLRKDF